MTHMVSVPRSPARRGAADRRWRGTECRVPPTRTFEWTLEAPTRRRNRATGRELDQRRTASLSDAAVRRTGPSGDTRERVPPNHETRYQRPDRSRRQCCHDQSQGRGRGPDWGLQHQVGMVVGVGNAGQGRGRVDRARLPGGLLRVVMGHPRMSNGMPDLPSGLYGARQEQKRKRSQA